MWENIDAAVHTVTSDQNSTVAFDRGDIGADTTFIFTFTQAGGLIEWSIQACARYRQDAGGLNHFKAVG